ncbi:hypothetical protein J5N97_015057 [Dioscorea zingiberensis]|uniref:Glycosyltransferase n=1 Tax=Dioscorea zingiberensis TaxID=325984 RepID=A0A9D5CWB8_9LILI|nr:hypothetical protein J5N97_015057 [Dioscorea zingiberensis]
MAAHVLVFPFPAQGHLNSMLKLAELLSLSGLQITFLTTEYHHSRLCLHSQTHARLSQRPGFWFRSISDGLPDQKLRSAARLLELYESLTYNSSSLFRDFLISNQRQETQQYSEDGWSRITCMVVDGIMPFAMDVATDLGVPTIAFRTSSPCSIWSYFCLPSLVQAGEFPFPEEGDLDERIHAVPGMESFLRRRDLPSFFRKARDMNDPGLRFVYEVTASTTRAKAFILNTFEAMDGTVLSHIRTVCPTTYAIGPLHTMLRRSVSSLLSNTTSSNSANLREEDRSCLTWLDKQPKGSVVYVSFGSFAVMTDEDLMEFWHGLVNSGQRFLWVIRPDLVNGVEEEGSQSLSVPPEVAEATRERGCLVAWAPQEEVLAHPSLGCFLTHSGWNSTLESVVAGVPMICWPFFVDQQITSRFVSQVWKIGLDMKDMNGREVVERMVREAMEGERAQELKKSATAMAEKARESVEEGGSSYMDLQSLVHYLKSTASSQTFCGEGDD